MQNFVCATSKSIHNFQVVFSSYYSSRRGSDRFNNTTIWQAARATSAASSFFDPIKFGNDEYIDGATISNNPISVVWSEAADVWRESPHWRLSDNVQCLVSVGTGVPSLRPFGDSLFEVGQTLLAIATETESTWEQFQREHSDLDENKRLFRFNVLRGLGDIGLEKASEMDAIITATRNFLEKQGTFKELGYCAACLLQRESASNFA